MTYQVLARKWRPKNFASLVGQEHVVRALTHALDGGRLHHAYLFTGTRGVGKTTLSRIFAKALNCETGVSAAPCGVCRACREIDEGRFVDYVEMDAASNRGVDEMAALLERAVYAPVDARFKVYMIDEVHMLTNHAFNAMLKTLEEPPSHVKFILATTDPQKIPVTVLSRCLQFNLKQMPAGHIVSHLEHILGEEQIAFEPQALRLLARAAEGSMRDALSLTDQAIAYSANQVTEEAVSGMLGTLDQSYLIRLLDALAAGDGLQVLAIADEMSLRSLSFSNALQDLAGLLHRVAWAQFALSSVLDEWPEANDLRRFADALAPEQVQLFYQIATLGRSELGLAPDEYAGFTMTLLRMLAFEPAAPGGGAAPAPRAGMASASGAGRQPVAAAVVTQAVEPVRQVARNIEALGDTPFVQAAELNSAKVATPEIAVGPANAIPQNIASREESPATIPMSAESEPAPSAPSLEISSQVRAGAGAALDVLRNAGMRVTADRGRATRTADTTKPMPAVVPKAPVPSVKVPVPRAAVRRDETADRSARGAVTVPPWDDVPLDDFIPTSAEDAAFARPDEGSRPSFDSARGDAGMESKGREAAPIDTEALPPPIALDAIGFEGDWPALAASLTLKGIAHQLAFNSELSALDGSVLKLIVPVPQYAESSQVAKLKAALAQTLGKPIEVHVEVGQARRTAAALDAAARAARQRDAEREIGADPFVQSLIHEFGASIVPGSIRPITPDTGALSGGAH
jgi:DNA polymerase-3 subunit gamma/tau